MIDPLQLWPENKGLDRQTDQAHDVQREAAGYKNAKDTATAWSKLIAEGLNYLTGGTEHKAGLMSPYPDQIDYLIGQSNWWCRAGSQQGRSDRIKRYFWRRTTAVQGAIGRKVRRINDRAGGRVQSVLCQHPRTEGAQGRRLTAGGRNTMTFAGYIQDNPDDSTGPNGNEDRAPRTRTSQVKACAA